MSFKYEMGELFEERVRAGAKTKSEKAAAEKVLALFRDSVRDTVAPVTADTQTRTITIVVQHVGPTVLDEPFNDIVAAGLREYLKDSRGGIFERHITANQCRIEAIRSLDPSQRIGIEFSAGVAGTDGFDALSDRLSELALAAEFLPGGENWGSPVDQAIDYDPNDDIRKRIAEIVGTIPAA